MTTAELLATVFAGYSTVAALVLLAALASVYRSVELPAIARAAGAALLLGLAALQALHVAHFAAAMPLVESRLYVALLLAVAPAFYLFCAGVLRPQRFARPVWLLLFAPALIAPALPARIAVPLAFVLGAAYAAHLAKLVYDLRAQRRRHRLEFAAFVALSAAAVLVLLLGLGAAALGEEAYFIGYSVLTGLGFAGASYLLLRYPDLPAGAVEAVRSAYASTTLRNVDTSAALARLRDRMEREKLYADENLSLARLAEAVALTPHQLSELVNTELGVGFPRFVREYRVAAAQRMLLTEPGASVLSVGLAVGFTSQSNFYAAFREITGEVPGRFREKAAALAPRTPDLSFRKSASD